MTKKTDRQVYAAGALIVGAIVLSLFFWPDFLRSGYDAVGVLSIECVNYTASGASVFKVTTDEGVKYIESSMSSISVKTLVSRVDVVVNDYSKGIRIADRIFFQWKTIPEYDAATYDAYGPKVKDSAGGFSWSIPLFCGNTACVQANSTCDDGIWDTQQVSSEVYRCWVSPSGDSPQAPPICATSVISTDSCQSYKRRGTGESYVESDDGIIRVFMGSATTNCGDTGCPTEFSLRITLDQDWVKHQAQYSVPDTTTSTLYIVQTTTSTVKTTTTLKSTTTTATTTSTTLPSIQPQPRVPLEGIAVIILFVGLMAYLKIRGK